MKMKYFFVLFFMVAFLGIGKSQVVKSDSLFYMCDTTNSSFIRNNNAKASKLSKHSKQVIHIYDGSSYYYPAYSVIAWSDSSIVNGLFIGDDGSDKSNGKKIKDPILDNLNIDSLISELTYIHNAHFEPEISITHDHLVYFSFWNGNKNISFKFCDSQIILFPEKDRIKYLNAILTAVRKQNRH